VAEGTPDQLKSSVGRSTLQLVLEDHALLPAAEDTVRRLLGAEPLLTPEQSRINVALENADQAADVLIALRSAEVSIASVTVQKPSLDEVFLALTGHDTNDSTDHTTLEAVR
jgi:ABC-2 type transport system ATP-binding protein